MFLNQIRKRAAIAVALLTLGTASMQAWDNVSDAKLPQSSRRIVMMGNSITDYWLNHVDNNHKEFFTDNGALCRGIAGQKTPAMLSRFASDVVSIKPLVTVIAGGVNDINAGLTVDSTYNNAVAMAEAAVKAGIRPILTTINPSGWGTTTVNNYIAYNKKIKAYCDLKGYSFCNYFDAVTMGTVNGNFSYSGTYNEMKPEYRGRIDNSDHLHPCKTGYLVMESVLIPLIEANVWKNGVYEAENATKKSAIIQDATDNNASGKTCVSYVGKGNMLSLGFTANLAGAYNFIVTYAAGADRNLAITVNGIKQTVSCKNSGGFTFLNKSTVSVKLQLKAGYNTFVLGDQTDDAPNLDKFEIPAATLGERFSTFSVIGDSYSTYQGYMETGVGKDNATAEYPSATYDLTDVSQTWWKRFESLTGIKLEQNNSISGTCMSYISLNGSGTTKTVSFVNRIPFMRKADLFVIEGGTNDFSGGRTTYSVPTDATITGLKIVGDYKWDGFIADMPDYRFVRPTVAYMIWYLQQTYPGCTVAFMANNTIPAEGRESFKAICQHYGAIYYEMSNISKTNGHPLKAGMDTIANQLVSTVKKADLVGLVSTSTTTPITGNWFYVKNVGTGQYIKAGKIVGADEPILAAQADRTALSLTQNGSTYTIASAENANGWGVQGRNTIYDSNTTIKTNSWGTTLIPGWTFVNTGDSDGSVYIKYTWGTYTAGSKAIESPAGKTYGLFYGAWALGTVGWAGSEADVTGTQKVYPDLYDKITTHGANAKWILEPINGATIQTGISIITIKNDDSFIVNPNELSNGTLNIDFRGRKYNTLSIFSSTGMLVFSKQLNGENSLSLNVNGVLSKGMYLVSAKSNSAIATQKVIVK